MKCLLLLAITILNTISIAAIALTLHYQRKITTHSDHSLRQDIRARQDILDQRRQHG
jgi:hypothetical protein